MEKGGTKRTGVPVKTLKKLLKRAGLKVSGKKATLTRRAKKARLMKGGGFFDNFNIQTPAQAAKSTAAATTRSLSPGRSSMVGSLVQKSYDTNPDWIKSQQEAAELQATTAVNNEAALRKANNQNARVAVEEAARRRGDFYHQPNVGSGKKKRSRRS